MLRDLGFALGFNIDGASDLEAASGSVDGLKAEVEGIEPSIDSFSNNANKAAEETSGAFDSMSSKVGGSIDFLDKHFKKITGSTLAVGGGLELLNRKEAGTTEAIGRMSRATGILDSDMRELVTSTSNVTFPISDVVEIMETGTQRGIEGADALREYATFWDTVGDATGESGPKLADSAVALEAIGIGVENQTEALDAFGYITENTTQSVGGFLRFLERTGPQLRELGLDVNDTAGLMALMQEEFGMSGRIARTEFRKAVNESDGDLKKMLETLGTNNETLKEYTGRVEGSSQVISDNANAHAESYTAMEKLGQNLDVVTTKFSPVLKQLDMMVPVLLSVGPLIKGLWAAKTRLAFVMNSALLPAFWATTKAVVANTVALLANPIGATVAAVIALGAGLFALYKNWDTVSAAVVNFGGVIKSTFLSAKDTVFGFFTDIGDKIYGFKQTLLNIDVVGAIVDGIKEKGQAALDAVGDFAGKVRGFLPFSPADEGPLSDLDKTGEGLVNTFGDSIRKNISGVGGAMKELTGAANDELTAQEPNVTAAKAGRQSGGGAGIRFGDINITMSGDSGRENMIAEAVRRFEQKLRAGIDSYVEESASSEGVVLG